MKTFLIILALCLAGCANAPAAAPVYVAQDVVPVEAQRIIDHATATAQVMATQNAMATQARLVVEQEQAAQATGTMQSIVVIQTQRADAFTATAIVMSIDATQQAGTREALSNMRADAATQQAINIQATAQAANNERTQMLASALTNIIIATAALTAGIVLWFVQAFFRAQNKKHKSEYDPALVRVIRLPRATLILTPTVNGVHRELIRLPQPDTESTLADEEDFDTEAEPPEEAPQHSGSTQRSPMPQRTEAELTAEENRRFVLSFLKRAMATADPDGDKLPDHRAMDFSSDTWQRAVRLLGERVRSRKSGRGGGTFLASSLKELYDDVGERRFAPHIVIEVAPTPLQPVEVEAA